MGNGRRVTARFSVGLMCAVATVAAGCSDAAAGDGHGDASTTPGDGDGGDGDGGDGDTGDSDAGDGDAVLPDAAIDYDADLSAIGPAQLLVGGFEFLEGPAWDRATSTLLFSDIPADTIYRLVPPDSVDTYRSPSRRANGLAFDRQGRLLAAEHQSRTVTRTLAGGGITTIAAQYQGLDLNSPNDLVVRSDGTIYFTDPTYGLGGRPAGVDFTGLYRIDPQGGLHLEARIDNQPNGVALSPDEGTLYVVPTRAPKMLAFTVAQDGVLSDRRAFADVPSGDGMAVDAAGHLYVASAEGVLILDPQGARLGVIESAEQPANCTFGGDDGHTLYITAGNGLYAVRVPIPGVSFP